MRLIIVRHAETIHNRDKISYSVNDESELTSLGKKQAKLLANFLVKQKIDLIYSSDLKRCKDTLKPLLELREIPVVFSKNLRELNVGVFSGKASSEYTAWKMNAPGPVFDRRPEGGESFNDVRKRTGRFISEELNLEKNKGVLIMTHGYTKRALLMNLFKRDDEDYYNELKELSKNTSMTILELGDFSNHKVESFYSIEHLEDLNKSVEVLANES